MTGSGSRRVAAIDCGTNSLRLLIADIDPASHRLTDVQRRMEIVRLGQGVDATGRLAPDALARTFAMLEQYARAIDESGATAIRLVATSATRDASNAADFAAGVRQVLGVDPEVITGAEEAYLSFSGATAELGGLDRAGIDRAGQAGEANPPEAPFLVVDIGGGSTEFVYGGANADSRHGLSAISVDIGCVRLTERHLHDDPPTRDQVAEATSDIDAALATVAKSVPVTRAHTLVGLAGSVTTVAAIALGLAVYDPARIHHARISAGRVHEVTADLLGREHGQRAAMAVIHPGRIDVIGAGALILDRVMDRFGFAEMVASEHDILDGIAWSIAARPARQSSRLWAVPATAGWAELVPFRQERDGRATRPQPRRRSRPTRTPSGHWRPGLVRWPSLPRGSRSAARARGWLPGASRSPRQGGGRSPAKPTGVARCLAGATSIRGS
jgi:exopolyphosphatase/guanosine-5'-triphosphate,3'-diphosphate pyrophosphatase